MARIFSHLSHLSCSHCHQIFVAEQVQTYCVECPAPLLAVYELGKIKRSLSPEDFSIRGQGMWRWHEILPVQSPEYIVSLGEGDTPLLKVPRLANLIDHQHIYIKEEGLNPTGTFKARGLSAALSKANEFHLKQVIIPTAGNAGGATAAYAARSGIKAKIWMPEDTPLANQLESKITGANINLVQGLISDAGRLAALEAEKYGWFDLSTFKEPYRLEGKKIMGYELAEHFNWELPDVIIYPTGGGTGLVGMWKAFQELTQLDWLKSPKFPRMVAVQAEGCAPVVKAFKSEAQVCEYWEQASTGATGLQVPKSFADRLIMNTIYESEGCAISVSEEEIQQSWHEIAQIEGIFSAPEGAATWAAAKKLVQSKWITPSENVVLFNTGTGLKYLELAQKILS